MAIFESSAASTHTLDDFIENQSADQITFRNFSLFEKLNDLEIFYKNILEDYMDSLKNICIKAKLDTKQYQRYRYFPDLLAYDVYGSTQLDFIILFCNDIIDPKDFDFKELWLPYANKLKDLLNNVYNSNRYYISNNKYMNGFANHIV